MIGRAVVTGGSGVVGTALIKELTGRGTKVLAVLRPSSPNNDKVTAIPGVTPVYKSIEDLGSIELPEGETYDAFFHLGWTGTKGRDRFDPEIHTKNIGYSLDAVELAHRLGCSVFLGAGSQAEYGRCDGVLTPMTPAFPENAYGAGKLAAGTMTRIKARESGMRHVWTRILSVYGPGDAASTMVTSFIKALSEGRRPSVTKGEQVWDYLYSSDAARALTAIAEKGLDGKTYLVASGEARTLRSYMEEMRDIVSPGAEIGFGEVPYAAAQVMHLAADISETTADTGWRPEVSFAEGVRAMAASVNG